MKNMRVFRFWKNWGLISRLMLAVGIAIIAGGGVQTALLLAEGRAEHSTRLQREQREILTFSAPLVADQALVGEYQAISELLRNQVKRGEVDRFVWTDRDGRKIVAHGHGQAGQARHAGDGGRGGPGPVQPKERGGEADDPPLAAVRQAAADR